MIWEVSNNKRLLILKSATEIEIDQLNLTFKKRIENWRFDPRVKKGWWDGYISYFKRDQFLPAGLWNEVVEMCKEFNFPLDIKNIESLFDNDFDEEHFRNWVETNWSESEKESREYQINTAARLIKYKSCLAELATAAGKTLITFKYLSYLFSTERAKRVLMIVPTVDLVIQSAADFVEYNEESVNIDLKIQQIYAGMKIKEDTNLVVGTYQSLVKKNKKFFDSFDAVIVDEVHQAKAASIKTILEKCEYAWRKVGLSGTIPKRGTLNRLTIMAYTGPIITTIKADYLIKEGYIAPCKIYSIQMDYAPKKLKEEFRSLFYQSADDRKRILKLEQDYVISNQHRLQFISDFILKNPKNCLALFYRTEYGKKLYDKLRNESIGTGKQVYHIDGSTDKSIREKYKELMEEGENKVLVASYGTFSTGINIKNLHSVYLTESFKSDTIIRQSIGRGLRTHKNKNVLMVFDFVDDFSLGKYKNYLFRHSQTRIEIYKEQGFPYTIKKVAINTGLI